MSAAEVGTGQYATTKGISQSNLITTVTPEKKAEEERDEEEDRRRKAEEATPVSVTRHEGKVQPPGWQRGWLAGAGVPRLCGYGEFPVFSARRSHGSFARTIPTSAF